MFQCDATLRVGAITGEVSDLLECDGPDLEVYGWQPYVSKDSNPAIQRMMRELTMWQSGRYNLHATSRTGNSLILRIRTFVAHEEQSRRIHGAVDLVQWASPRTYIDLKVGT